MTRYDLQSATFEAVALPQDAVEQTLWAPTTLDELRDAVGEEEFDAGMDRLAAKAAAVADRYRATGKRIIPQA